MLSLENSYSNRPRRLLSGDRIIGAHNLFGLPYCPVVELVTPTYLLLRHPTAGSIPTVIGGEKLERALKILYNEAEYTLIYNSKNEWEWINLGFRHLFEATTPPSALNIKPEDVIKEPKWIRSWEPTDASVYWVVQRNNEARLTVYRSEYVQADNHTFYSPKWVIRTRLAGYRPWPWKNRTLREKLDNSLIEITLKNIKKYASYDCWLNWKMASPINYFDWTEFNLDNPEIPPLIPGVEWNEKKQCYVDNRTEEEIIQQTQPWDDKLKESKALINKLLNIMYDKEEKNNADEVSD